MADIERVRADQENDQAIAELAARIEEMIESNGPYGHVCSLIFSKDSRQFQRRLASHSAKERDAILAIAVAAMHIGFTQAVALVDDRLIDQD